MMRQLISLELSGYFENAMKRGRASNLSRCQLRKGSEGKVRVSPPLLKPLYPPPSECLRGLEDLTATAKNGNSLAVRVSFNPQEARPGRGIPSDVGTPTHLTPKETVA